MIRFSLICTFVFTLGASAQTARAGTTSGQSCDSLIPTATSSTSPDTSICSRGSKAGSPIAVRFPNGTVIPSLAFIKEIDQGPPTATQAANLKVFTKALAPSPAQASAIKKLTSQIIDLYKEKLRDSKNKVYAETVIARLSNLKTNFDVDSDRCGKLGPQANYKWATNTLSICRSSMNLPAESVASIIAHELGHAVDPCSFDRLVVDQKKIGAVVRGDHSALKSCGISSAAVDTAAIAISGTSNYESVGSSYAHLLVACGFAKLEVQGAEAYSLRDTPFAKMRSCTDSQAADSKRTSQQLESLFAQEKSNLEQMGISIPLTKLPVTPASGDLQCGGSAMEHFADTVGSLITADYLAANAATLDPIRLKQVLYAASADECVGTKNDGLHPEAKERLLLALQYPEVQRAVGCDHLESRPRCADTALRPAKTAPTRTSPAMAPSKSAL